MHPHSHTAPCVLAIIPVFFNTTHSFSCLTQSTLIHTRSLDSRSSRSDTGQGANQHTHPSTTHLSIYLACQKRIPHSDLRRRARRPSKIKHKSASAVQTEVEQCRPAPSHQAVPPPRRCQPAQPKEMALATLSLLKHFTPSSLTIVVSLFSSEPPQPIYLSVVSDKKGSGDDSRC